MNQSLGIYWALISTIVSVAVSVGHYENRPLANVLWGFSACLWLMWLLHRAAVSIPHLFQSADEKAKQHRIKVFERLGRYTSAGELLLLEISLVRRNVDGSLKTVDPEKRKADTWTDDVYHYLRRHVSEHDAKVFWGLERKPLSEGISTSKELLDKRLHYLHTLKQEIRKTLVS